MIVSCNVCHKRYLIDATLISAQGRTVRCASCGHAWTQHPEVLDIKLADVDMGINDGQKVRTKTTITILITIACLLITSLSLYWMRHSLAQRWPSAGRFLENMGVIREDPTAGLVFENVIPFQNKERGQQFLILKGEILNTTKSVRQLSPLTVVIHGSCAELGFMKRMWAQFYDRTAPDRCVVDKWQHHLTQSRLLPGEKLSFETSPHAIHHTASEVAIEF